MHTHIHSDLENVTKKTGFWNESYKTVYVPNENVCSSENCCYCLPLLCLCWCYSRVCVYDSAYVCDFVSGSLVQEIRKQDILATELCEQTEPCRRFSTTLKSDAFSSAKVVLLCVRAVCSVVASINTLGRFAFVHIEIERSAFFFS